MSFFIKTGGCQGLVTRIERVLPFFPFVILHLTTKTSTDLSKIFINLEYNLSSEIFKVLSLLCVLVSSISEQLIQKQIKLRSLHMSEVVLYSVEECHI